jgi:hypothetical protein
MTRRLTRITLPGSPNGSGLMDWGELSAENMIGQLRRLAEHQKAQAEAILAADDEDFQVDLVEGSCVERFVRTIQQARGNQ